MLIYMAFLVDNRPSEHFVPIFTVLEGVVE